MHLRFNRDMIERDFLTATFAIKKRGLKKKIYFFFFFLNFIFYTECLKSACLFFLLNIFFCVLDGTFCTQCLKSACLVFILKITFFKLLKCTVATPAICCS